MKTLIKEYGSSLLSGAAFYLIVGLLFTGLALMTSALAMTRSLDTGLIHAEKSDGEKAMMNRLNVRSDNISMASDTYIGIDQKVYYERNGADSIIRLKKGRAERLHINEVCLLRGEEKYSNGYEVTDQVLHEDEYGNDSYLQFGIPGCYRIVVSVKDSGKVVSNYQLFIYVGKRRTTT